MPLLVLVAPPGPLTPPAPRVPAEVRSEAAELRRDRLNWKAGSWLSEAAPALAGDITR